MKKFLCIENLFILFLVAAIIFEGYDAFSNESKQILYSNAVSPNIILTGARDITLPTEDEIVSGMTNEEIVDAYIRSLEGQGESESAKTYQK